MLRQAVLLVSSLLLLASPLYSLAQDAPEMSYRTPQKVFDAYQKALAAADGRAALHCLTDRERQRMLFEMAFATGIRGNDALLEKHTDKKLHEKWLKEHGKPKGDESAWRFVAETLRDPAAFFSEGLETTKHEIVDNEPLRDVKIDGDRAQGLVTRYMTGLRKEAGGPEKPFKEPYDARVYFKKTKDGWKIDTPRGEELKPALQRDI